jgi:hypothetical protein
VADQRPSLAPDRPSAATGSAPPKQGADGPVSGPAFPGGPYPPASRVRWFFLASAILSALVLKGLVLPLAGAAVLAFVSEGPIDFILRKLRRQESSRLRWLVSAAFVLAIVAGLLLPLTFAAIGAITELVAVLGKLDWDDFATWGTGSVAWARRRAAEYGLDIPEREIADRVRAALTTSFSFLGTRLGTLVSSTPTLVFDLVILLVAWITFAVEGRASRKPRAAPPHPLGRGARDPPQDDRRGAAQRARGERGGLDRAGHHLLDRAGDHPAPPRARVRHALVLPVVRAGRGDDADHDRRGDLLLHAGAASARRSSCSRSRGSSASSTTSCGRSS